MKVSLFGITGIPIGKHNVKDARLDQIHKMVEAKKKVYVHDEVQVQVQAITQFFNVATSLAGETI